MVPAAPPAYGPPTMRHERGQATTEWLAVMAVVLVLLGAMALTIPRVAPVVVCELTQLITGQACEIAGEGELALPPCVITDRDGQVKAAVTVFSIKGGGKVRVIKQRRSDGTWAVTAVGGGELGLQVGSPGARAAVDAGGGSAGGGAGAEGGVAAQGEYGASWVYDSEQAADRQISIIQNELRDRAIEVSAGPLAPLAHIGTSIFGEDRELGEPRIEYLQGGFGANAKGEAGTAKLNIDGAHALGVRWDHGTGEKTQYYKYTVKGGVSAKALRELGIEGDAEVQLAVTYDRDGKPLRASILTRGGASAKLPKVLNAKQVKLDLRDGGRVDADVHLDLRDPANRAAWDAFRGNPFTGTDDLADAFADRGRVQVRAYRTGRDGAGFDINGKLGLKFGVEGGFEGNRADLVGAWEGDVGGGLVQSAECTNQ